MYLLLGTLNHLRSRAWLALLVAVAVAGCASYVPPFDQAGVTRITELSKKSLSVYQTLLDAKVGARPDALTGSLAKSVGDLQTEIRVHLVFEQAREKNSGSIAAAKELSEFWEAALNRYCTATKPEAPPTPPTTSVGQAPSAPAPGSGASAPPSTSSTLCAGRGGNSADAMADFVLKQDRTSLERILGAMVKAEEAKKLAGSGSK